MRSVTIGTTLAITISVLPACRSRSGSESARLAKTGQTPAPQARADSDAIGHAVANILRGAAGGEDDDAAIAALVALGDPAIPALSRAVTREDEDARLVVVQALGKIGGKDAVDVLLAALHDARWNVRLNAVEALGQIGDRRAVQPLLAQYHKDDDAQVRYECLTSLGLIGDPAAAGVLVKETSSRDPYVRMWAMDALCVMRDPHAPPLASSLLKDSNQYVRRQVLQSCRQALDTSGGHQALIDMALAAKNYQASVLARVYLLGYVKKGTSESSKLSEMIRTAGRGALGGEHGLRAALLLGDLADPIAIDPLVRALHDPNVLVRHQAAYDLGKIADPRAVPALIAALRDKQPFVTATAYNSLQWFAEAGNARARQAVEKYTGETFPHPLPR